MPGQLINSSSKPYLRIVGGNLCQPAKQGDEGARLRQYELPNGSKGEKWEIPFMNWTGVIRSIRIQESEFGESCIIELDDAYISLNVNSRFFTDFACKVHNADLSQPIVFHPYDMEVDGKRVAGISMKQGEHKLKSYYYDGSKNIHGFPEVDKEKSSKKSYWKIYFAEVADFLTSELKKLKFQRLNDNLSAFNEAIGLDADFDPSLPF